MTYHDFIIKYKSEFDSIANDIANNINNSKASEKLGSLAASFIAGLIVSEGLDTGDYNDLENMVLKIMEEEVYPRVTAILKYRKAKFEFNGKSTGLRESNQTKFDIKDNLSSIVFIIMGVIFIIAGLTNSNTGGGAVISIIGGLFFIFIGVIGSYKS